MPDLNLTITDIMHGETPVLKIMKGDTQKWPTPYKDQYLTFKALEMGTFQFTKAVNYSINGGEWTALAAATDTPTLEPGDKIRWKATLTPDNTNGIGTFSSTGKYNAYGNPLSLRRGDNYKGVTSLPNNYIFKNLFQGSEFLVNAKDLSLHCTTITTGCYNSMFYGCTNLITTPELPATTVPTYGYSYMFYNCTSLVNAPALPATNLIGNQPYSSMFRGCSSLKVVPDLPATTLIMGCYQYMFQGCTSLEMPMSELPAANAVQQCYEGMFSGCTSLTEMPVIKATTGGAACCKDMFNGCTSLVTTHDLLLTTWSSGSRGQCQGMFIGCTSMEVAPALPALTFITQCYYNMFQYCTNLKYVKCLGIGTPGNATSYWLYQIPSTGTFVKHPDMANWPRSASGIPSGWTVEDAVLE